MEKRYFKNPCEKQAVSKCDCSQKVFKKYALRYDEKGQVRICETGEYNVYELIQSYKNDCDLNYIQKMITMTGNPELFKLDNSKLGFDTTDLPKSLLEAKIATDRAGNLYKSMPDELTKGLSMEEFVQTFKLGDIVSYIKSKEKKEVDE